MMDHDIQSLLWIDQDRESIPVKIYIYVDPEVPKIHTISHQDFPELLDTGLHRHEIVSSWTIPNRSEMEHYRRQASIFNPQSNSVMVDEITLSDWVVANHIVSLSVDGHDIELQHDTSGVLTSDSLKRIKSLHSGLYDIIYAQYCSEACLFL